jgi:hypothetical protein
VTLELLFFWKNPIAEELTFGFSHCENTPFSVSISGDNFYKGVLKGKSQSNFRVGASSHPIRDFLSR